MRKKGYIPMGSMLFMSMMFAGMFVAFVILVGTTGQVNITIEKDYHEQYKSCSAELNGLENNFEEFKEAKIENVCPKQKEGFFAYLVIAVLYGLVGFVIGDGLSKFRTTQQQKPKKKKQEKEK